MNQPLNTSSLSSLPSLRDYFAIHLLACAWKELDIGELGYSGMAEHVWKMADAMLKAREQISQE